MIHRDLKPANIKVTGDGKVKVLDFGLAKAFEGNAEDVSLSNSPTLSMNATKQGVILGTAAYMSPEQARGETTDKRADIWGFGCVLFEMLTGSGTFDGRTVSDVLAGVLRADPDWNSLPPRLHPRIRLLLERCLEKEPKYRSHDVAEARAEIQKVLDDPGGVLAQSVADVSQAAPQSKLPWVAALVLGALISGLAVWNLRPTPQPDPRPVMRFDYDLPDGRQFRRINRPAVAISPDGSQILYNGTGGFYLRSLDELEDRLIPGSEETDSSLSFSPDGESILYVSPINGQVRRIAVSGGAPVTISDMQIPGYGASWGSVDNVLFGQTQGIMQVPASGGTPELVIEADSALALAVPQLLPGGNAVLFTELGADRGQIAVHSFDSGERKVLLEGEGARYVSTGHLVYLLDSVLLAVPFDLDALEVAGGPVSMVEDVQGNPAQFDISDTGSLVYILATAGSGGRRTLTWVDRNGQEEPLAAEARAYFDPRISPDGTKVALAIDDSGNLDVWIWDLVRENLIRLTFEEAEDRYPLWSPDGEEIFFYSQREGSFGVHSKAADGTGEVELVGSEPGRILVPWSWSADGNTLLLTEFSLTGTTNFDIGALSMEGDRPWTSLLAEDYLEGLPVISPSGNWMAYNSDESGQSQVYVRPFPEIDTGRWQPSTSGGQEPAWSPNLSELFYRNGDQMMVVDVETEPTFSPGTPRELFSPKFLRVQSVSMCSDWGFAESE